jgi:hypothetical protein
VKAGNIDEGISVHQTSSSTARPFGPTLGDNSERASGVTSTVAAGKFSNRVAPAPPGLPNFADDDDSQETSSASKAIMSAQLASPYHGKPTPQPIHELRQDGDPAVSAEKPKQAASMIRLEPAIATVTPPHTHADRTPSDANSFATAEEGTDGEADMPVATPSAPNRTDAPSGSKPTESESAKTTTTVTHASEAEPAALSVLVSRLTPLRSILQHATSADECRMLLNAYCTQIGIPLDVNAGRADFNAEAKVHAWLLDHEAGPPVPWPWSPPMSPSRDTERHEHITAG